MVNKEFKLRQEAFVNYFKALEELRKHGVLINNKDFTCQVGEWLVETIYEGKRSVNGIQKGWDIEVDGKYIQVKSHAKAKTNNTSFSAVTFDSTERIDELIIVVFSHDYKLKSFYKVPWNEAEPHIKLRGKKSPRNELKWSSIEKYRVDINSLPQQEIIAMFR